MASYMKNKEIISYKLLFILTCFLSIIIISGCSFRKPEDKVIHDIAFQLSQKEFVIKLDPPLARTHNSASVFLAIQENWTAEPPWTGIKLQSGKNINVGVSLKTAEDKKYSAKIIGAAVGAKGKFLQARFEPEIPTKDKITSVHLSASENITCTKVLWHNYDPN